MKPISLATLLAAGALLTSAAGQNRTEPSLASKVQRLEDMEEIRTVLLNYGRTLDAHDFGAYSRLFAKDGEWVGGFGSVKGPPAIEAFMAKNIGSPGKPGGTYHLLTNFIINVHGDTASAWSRWTFVTPGPDKKPAMAQGAIMKTPWCARTAAGSFNAARRFAISRSRMLLPPK